MVMMHPTGYSRCRRQTKGYPDCRTISSLVVLTISPVAIASKKKKPFSSQEDLGMALLGEGRSDTVVS